MASKLTLQDLLIINGIDPKDVLLIRHSLKHDNFRKCYEANFIHEYTQIQPDNLKALSEHKYWMVFISSKGTQAIFYKMYDFKGKTPISECSVSKDYPGTWMDSDMIYKLDENNTFNEWERRLIIDWGKDTINWYHKGIKETSVIAIQTVEAEQFPGYDSLVLSHDKLQAIVDDVTGEYQYYVNALSDVKGVYLILDTKTGDQYIGSASGNSGILERWSQYAKPPYHGGNKRMIMLLNENKDEYKYFQFSILQIFSKGTSEEVILDTEALYKKKLGSKVFGLNAN